MSITPAPQVEMVSDEMVGAAYVAYIEDGRGGSFSGREAMRVALQAALNARAGGDGWIAVTDRTPPEDTPVWCFIEGGDPFIGGYCYVDGDEASGWAWHTCENSHYMHGDKWEAFDFIWDDQYDVTHWQPLPTPPAALASQAVGVKDGR